MLHGQVMVAQRREKGLGDLQHLFFCSITLCAYVSALICPELCMGMGRCGWKRVLSSVEVRAGSESLRLGSFATRISVPPFLC